MSGVAIEEDLLIDTGSHVTVIQYRVVEALDATLRIREHRMEESRGFGGRTTVAVVPIELEFGTGGGVFRFGARVAVEPNPLGDLPSALGMDFISSFRLTVSRNENIVELRPTF